MASAKFLSMLNVNDYSPLHQEAIIDFEVSMSNYEKDKRILERVFDHRLKYAFDKLQGVEEGNIDSTAIGSFLNAIGHVAGLAAHDGTVEAAKKKKESAPSIWDRALGFISLPVSKVF